MLCLQVKFCNIYNYVKKGMVCIIDVQSACSICNELIKKASNFEPKKSHLVTYSYNLHPKPICLLKPITYIHLLILNLPTYLPTYLPT
jgi:hypothetical protein